MKKIHKNMLDNKGLKRGVGLQMKRSGIFLRNNMRDVKKHNIFLGVLIVMICVLTACGRDVITYTYENEEVLGVKIKETEVYPDKLVIKFAKDSFSEVERVECYGADFSVIEEHPEFSFRRNTLTIETQNASLISGLYVEENEGFYVKVRYLDSDEYAMLVYAEYDDAGLLASGDKDDYYTQEEKDEQEARKIALTEKENASYEKLLGTWVNESETVCIKFFPDVDSVEKRFTVYELTGNEWVERENVYVSAVTEEETFDSIEITLYDNPSWGCAYYFYICNDNTGMECSYSDEKFVKKQTFEIDIEDEEYEAFVKNTINLSEDETIEKAEWVEENVCYRVSLERTTEIEGEYRHLADYIFVKEDTLKFIKVTYPSKLDPMESDRYVYDACDFEIKYEDVTFDGHKDIIISLGHQGAAGTCISCAYVYTEGEFVYVKSFEFIPNYSINDEEKYIEGYYDDKSFKYEFIEDQFVELQ